MSFVFKFAYIGIIVILSNYLLYVSMALIDVHTIYRVYKGAYFAIFAFSSILFSVLAGKALKTTETALLALGLLIGVSIFCHFQTKLLFHLYLEGVGDLIRVFLTQV